MKGRFHSRTTTHRSHTVVVNDQGDLDPSSPVWNSSPRGVCCPGVTLHYQNEVVVHDNSIDGRQMSSTTT